MSLFKGFSSFLDREIHVDLSARQRLVGHWELFAKANNITDEGRVELLGDPYGSSRFQQRERYGRSFAAGISYRR